jgi:hypothetical protein
MCKFKYTKYKYINSTTQIIIIYYIHNMNMHLQQSLIQPASLIQPYRHTASNAPPSHFYKVTFIANIALPSNIGLRTSSQSLSELLLLPPP